MTGAFWDGRMPPVDPDRLQRYEDQIAEETGRPVRHVPRGEPFRVLMLTPGDADGQWHVDLFTEGPEDNDDRDDPALVRLLISVEPGHLLRVPLPVEVWRELARLIGEL